MGRRKKKKYSPLIKYFFVSILIISFVVIALIKFIDILPNNYFGILIGVFVVIDFVLSCLLFNQKTIIRVLGGLLSAAFMFVMITGIVYELNTIDFLKKIGKIEYTTLNYKVLTLKSNDKINKITDLKNKNVGIVNEYKDEVTSKIHQKVSPKYKEYLSFSELYDKLLNNSVDAIVLEESIINILKEENSGFNDKVKEIYSFSIDIKQKSIKDKVNVTKKPFNIFISGIDTYGKINSVSRSDVNMVVTVNPKTKTILITSIPRDYYVKLSGKNEYDKITHSGVYGIETSVKTVEDFLNIDINYYVKVNFTSLVKLVDTLNGIDVDSKYEFISDDNFKYKKGINHLNGEEALSFARERHALPHGDKSRGENHQAVLTGIINKLTKKSILTKYNNILKSLKGSFVTNFSNNEITSFVKMQLDKNIDWKIEYLNLDGTDGYEYTYSYPKNKLYVMIPDKEMVNEVSNKINENFVK